mgnify:CR=1 FL=1
MTAPASPTHARLTFTDGFELVMALNQSIRVRNLDVNGVETWPVQTIVSGLYPPGDRQADYVHVEVTGREHRFDGVRIATGTVTAPAPPLLDAEAAHAVQEHEEPPPAPVEAPPAEPVASPPVEPVAPTPRAKRAKKNKAA